jgi:hypothetical protein
MASATDTLKTQNLEIGNGVIIAGLVSNPQYNGVEATITSCDNDKGKYGIKFIYSGETLDAFLSRENLIKFEQNEVYDCSESYTDEVPVADEDEDNYGYGEDDFDDMLLSSDLECLRVTNLKLEEKLSAREEELRAREEELRAVTEELRALKAVRKQQDALKAESKPFNYAATPSATPQQPEPTLHR